MSDESVLEELIQLMESDSFDPAAADMGAYLEELLHQMSDQLLFQDEFQSEVSPPAAVQTSCKKKCAGFPNKSESKLRPRIGFRTRSNLDVLEDGYRWRKYGKKPVKSNPNLRNYYRCLTAGCVVKKRIERDADDASYVITVYEGQHNHSSPTAVRGSSSSSKSEMLLVPAPCEMNGLLP